MGFSTNQPSDYFAMGIQPAKDVEATTFTFLRHLDGTAIEIDEDITTEREGGDGQEAGLRYKTMVKSDGQANVNARGQAGLVAFSGVQGRTATVIQGATSTPELPLGMQRHRFVPNPTLPFFTVEQRYADQVERVTNAKVTSVEVEGESGKPMKLSMSLVGGGTPYRRPIASALTPVREVSDVIRFPRGSYVLDGLANTKVTKIKWAAKRNIDDGIQTTEYFREDLVELNADYDVDLTVKYEDAALYNKVHYLGGTMVEIGLATTALRAYMVNGAPVGDAGHRAMGIDMPLLHIVGAKVSKLDTDGKTMYLELAAMTIKGATHSLIVDLVVPFQARLV